jgi:hypothetical protein
MLNFVGFRLAKLLPFYRNADVVSYFCQLAYFFNQVMAVSDFLSFAVLGFRPITIKGLPRSMPSFVAIVSLLGLN